MTSACATYGLSADTWSKIHQVFKTHPKITSVWLYGSRALGTFKLGSDIDLCIEGKDLTTTALLKIDNELDDLMLPWKIDLSLKHQLTNDQLLAHIERFGIRIYP